MNRVQKLRLVSTGLLVAAALAPPPSQAEAILQYFNTSWREISEKVPEIAEAGYGALWLPPPTKASGGFSVGYDLWDPFDLGSRDQRGTVSTKYGTESDLLHLVELAHRFGLRVYFDNIMNHRAFDIPGYNEDTPVDIYPGLLPEDFHLRVTEDGLYRKWDNTRDWSSSWQVQNLGLADLIDIAHEVPNANFGSSEGSSHPKLSFVRDPSRPGQYDRAPNGDYVGFGSSNGLTAEVIASNPIFYKEDVGAYLIRAARWLMDRTKADGLRLDAVKHVPSYFFGQQSGSGRDSSSSGYLGGIQWQFNVTRGYADWDNHRDSVFNHEQGRDDAFVFGEHLGTPPGYGEYIEAGMRLLDAPLHREMNSRLGNPSSTLAGLDQPGWSGDLSFNDSTSVSFAQSHDDDFSSRRELQHSYYLTRRGVANVYTDGYRKAGTLGESGGAFPRHANNPFLGQFGDSKLPHLLELREAFARGDQIPRWSDSDVVAYERRDKRESFSMDDANGTVLLFMLNDNYASGQARQIPTSFPSVAGGANAYLHNYSTFGGGFYVWASDIASGRVTIPPGGYFAFSWKNPDPSSLWAEGGGSPLVIRQSGQPVSEVRVTRRDGPDGDPEFNPYGLPNRGYQEGETPVPYTYQVVLPRVTDPTDLSFLLLSDGSTENVQMKLNGGVDINSQMEPILGPQSGDLRDNPPAWSTDTFLGYEQARFVHRQHPEKFAAALSSRNKFGSAGAETYRRSQSGEFSMVQGPINEAQNLDTLGGTASSFAYHDPQAIVSSDSPSSPGAGSPQFSLTSTGLVVWAKTPNVGQGFRAHLYYTVDGSNPEGAGGFGAGSTRTAPMYYRHSSDSGAGNWWSTDSIPSLPDGVELRYKVAVFRDRDGNYPVGSVWPSWQGEIERKLQMMTVFEVTGFNAEEALHYPHNDYATQVRGLPDGWHVLRARAYLNRGTSASRHAAIYKTFTQPFYLDASPPQGEVAFPSGDTEPISGQEYEFVVRTDRTVTEVWYHIADGTSSNDDLLTGRWAGNGLGGEPFLDSNRNGMRDPQESYEDITGNGVYDANLGESWARATRTSSPSEDPKLSSEWRFSYSQVPSSGTATVRVRLLEPSSLARGKWSSSTSDQAGHFTTLSRTLQTRGPASRVFVAWPPSDGETVGAGYVAKVYFSKSLTSGWDESAVKSAFTVRLQSAESGRTTGGTPQSRDIYGVVWDETPEYHALSVALPNMYNGDPDWLHGIVVDFLRPGVLSTTATRMVKAVPVPPPPFVEIVSPQEIGPDGRQVEIILPDLTAPTLADRQVPVTVRTAGPRSEVNLTLSFDFTPQSFSGTISLIPPSSDSPNPRVDGDTLVHEFVWSGAVEGRYKLRALVEKEGETNAATRSATVVFRQTVPVDSSGDSDNDGVPDAMEATQVPLPTRNDETWSNAEVHAWKLSARSDPTVVDTDGGGLPDGLQLGIEWSITPDATDMLADADGDGFPNFLPDLDPPIFNTPDRPGYEQRLPRTDQIGGSMTDPRRSDDDADSLPDSIEDLNRNGRVDIALIGSGGKAQSIIKHPDLPVIRNSSVVMSSALPSTARFLETDPSNTDTDGDGLADGQEDSNKDGRTDIFLLSSDGSRIPLDYTSRSSPHFKYNLVPNSEGLIKADGLRRDGRPNVEIMSRAVDYGSLFSDYSPSGTGAMQVAGWPKILIVETDPLVDDTIGTGLPDGWKSRYGLDPLDNGVYNFRTATPGNPDNLPTADLTGDGVTNVDHYLAGTDPRSTLQPALPGGPNKITIGPGSAIGEINGVPHYEEFSEWLASDIVALDEYHGDGSNSQSGDINLAGDQWDSSRDIVAFYARDGGDPSAGGDGKVYFRIDFDDLLPFAENGNLDIYIAINHTPGTGERVLPDEVDTLTEMRWRTVVAVYDSSASQVFVDTNPNLNSNNFGTAPSLSTGVESHPQGSALGVIASYFNSELDAVEFAVPRAALQASGWSGAQFGQLNFQVYTTKDGTANNPRGAGDLAGRSDLRDSILDDRIVEGNFFAQAGREDVLGSWMSFAERLSPPPSAKVVLVAEESQQLLPSGRLQSRINDGAGAGYHRAISSHETFGVPLSLAITPTLASGLQWASADPALGMPWKDGPRFNASISALGSAGLLDLLSVTHSGHTMLYTPQQFDLENISLASRWLESIYGVRPSASVLYLPERTLSGELLEKVAALGYAATFADQREHVEGWFGRASALSPGGYKPNRTSGVDLLIVNDDLASYRFSVKDGGSSTQMRRSLSRKSRHQDQEQVTIIVSSLDDFRTPGQASGYDKNLRWLSNRPWVEFMTATEVSNAGWTPVTRPSPPPSTLSKGFVQYASLGSYDNWYYGTSDREGLAGKRFAIRPGVAMPSPFGTMSSSGVSALTWGAVSPLSYYSPLGRLSRATMGASMFATAFHNQSSVDLRKFSNGEYINQPRTFENLSSSAVNAQSSLRYAAAYQRVTQWLGLPSSASLRGTSSEDIDLDGENEHLLWNNRLFAVFESLGGRMVSAWLRDPVSKKVWQVSGNLVSAAGFPDEREGGNNNEATRTSGFKDWFAQPSSGQGYSLADEMYSVEPLLNGFRFSSAQVVKEVTVAEGNDPRLEAKYSLTGLTRLYVRHGLSPNLEDLLVNGQAHLEPEAITSPHRVELVNDNGEDVVRAFVETSTTASVNGEASDISSSSLSGEPSVTRRSQPQVHQVEVELVGSGIVHTVVLGFDNGSDYSPPDPFADYMGLYFPPGSSQSLTGPDADPDGDGVSNYREFIMGSNPRLFDSSNPLGKTFGMFSSQFVVEFDTLPGRTYTVEYAEQLSPDTEWRPLPGAQRTGTGARQSVADPVGLSLRKFYRIRVSYPGD